MITSDSSVLWVALSFELLRGERSNEQYLCVAAHHQRDFGVCNRQSTLTARLMCHRQSKSEGIVRVLECTPLIGSVCDPFISSKCNRLEASGLVMSSQEKRYLYHGEGMG